MLWFEFILMGLSGGLGLVCLSVVFILVWDGIFLVIVILCVYLFSR